MEGLEQRLAWVGLAKGSEMNGDSRGAFLGSTGQVIPVAEWRPLRVPPVRKSDGGRRGMWMLDELLAWPFLGGK